MQQRCLLDIQQLDRSVFSPQSIEPRVHPPVFLVCVLEAQSLHPNLPSSLTRRAQQDLLALRLVDGVVTAVAHNHDVLVHLRNVAIVTDAPQLNHVRYVESQGRGRLQLGLRKGTQPHSHEHSHEGRAVVPEGVVVPPRRGEHHASGFLKGIGLDYGTTTFHSHCHCERKNGAEEEDAVARVVGIRAHQESEVLEAKWLQQAGKQRVLLPRRQLVREEQSVLLRVGESEWHYVTDVLLPQLLLHACPLSVNGVDDEIVHLTEVELVAQQNGGLQLRKHRVPRVGQGREADASSVLQRHHLHNELFDLRTRLVG